MSAYWNTSTIATLINAGRTFGYTTPTAWPTNKKLIELEHATCGTIYIHSQGRTSTAGVPGSIKLSLHPRKPLPVDLPRGASKMINPRSGTDLFSHSGMRKFPALVGREPSSRCLKCGDWSTLIAVLEHLAKPVRRTAPPSATCVAGEAV